MEGPTSSVSFRLLRAEGQGTAAAFNTGLAQSKAPVIGFGGAHTLYPDDHFATALSLLRAGRYQVVGGGVAKHAVPDRKGVWAKAMSLLCSSVAGAGVAAFHRRTEAGCVDTVYGGFYLREVFERVGSFDDALERNQDNELNARVSTAGFTIFFDPRLSTTYVMKTDPAKFLRRGFTLGSYHPR